MEPISTSGAGLPVVSIGRLNGQLLFSETEGAPYANETGWRVRGRVGGGLGWREGWRVVA